MSGNLLTITSVNPVTGLAADFTGKAQQVAVPIVTGLQAYHRFGLDLPNCLKNRAPISGTAAAKITGTGPISIGTSPPSMESSGPSAGIQLGVPDSPNLTIILAIEPLPVPPTPGVGSTFVALCSTAVSTILGFNFIFSTGLQLTAFCSGGTITPATLAMDDTRANIVSIEFDSSIPSAPVLTVRNHTANTVSARTGTFALSPSGTGIYLGGTPVSTINNIGPCAYLTAEIHNSVLSTNDLNTAVSSISSKLALLTPPVIA
ncbi:hypothetical protein ACELLULO517_07820 [Acidisoma cellulosilytica]|uniref:Uncharacterized protein n=1 Tax=Acidisoma cellulosilyticum TaxID=2802395 RepID=A0A964E396_9PROT|nr:hypothetical protein [Acidisoma cellulosilyticum]MCB8880139.1 hypothetical protein [Acidisoma cellulosilyticum]